jgi:hypothetical protein
VAPEQIKLSKLAGTTNITYKAEIADPELVPQVVIFR